MKGHNHRQGYIDLQWCCWGNWVEKLCLHLLGVTTSTLENSLRLIILLSFLLFTLIANVNVVAAGGEENNGRSWIFYCTTLALYRKGPNILCYMYNFIHIAQYYWSSVVKHQYFTNKGSSSTAISPSSSSIKSYHLSSSSIVIVTLLANNNSSYTHVYIWYINICMCV